MTPDPILLVDDEDELRILLRDTLRQDGFQVEDAADVHSALALMDRRHYPVVLTDLNMPGGPTGFDLIRAVQARDAQTLCVVITGYASIESAIRAVKFGAYDFVQKPFQLAEIEAVLNRALTHASLLSQLAGYQKELEARVLARAHDLEECQDKAMVLNRLLLDSLDETEESAVLQPFLAYLDEHFKPLRHAVYLPGASAWEPVGPDRPQPPPDLPSPAELKACLEFGQVDGVSEGYLVPLQHGGQVLAALHLEFPWRASFQLNDRPFVYWRLQLEAALHGLSRNPGRNA